jgi:tRNA (mo5U34)-methyltransferase
MTHGVDFSGRQGVMRYHPEMNLRQMVDSVPRWYHRFEFAPEVVTPGPNNSAEVLKRLNLPEDMGGKRVLDIGARDGFFSFECERRCAAEVVPIDYVPPQETGFFVAKEILGSRLNLLHENIYNLTPERYGQFDIVLCLGVLYHLPDPLRALNIIFRMMRPQSWLFLETVVIDDELSLEMADLPLARFYPKATKNRDYTNFWGMTEVCVVALMEECNLYCMSHQREGDRGIFVGLKTVERQKPNVELDWSLRTEDNAFAEPESTD